MPRRGGCPRRCAASTSQQREACCAAPDAAAELVELGDPEAIGVEDHHHGRVGHVDADLDHRGGDEHVELPARNSPIVISFSADVSRP